MTDSTMSEVNRTIGRRVGRVLYPQRNLEKTDEFFAPNYVNRNPAAPEDRHGPEKRRLFLSIYHNAFPDMQFTSEDVIAEGHKIVVRWTLRGTHPGELMGIPPPTTGWL